MKSKLLRKISAVAAILPILVLSAGFQPGIAKAEEGMSCSTITLTSGASTQTAGFTETNPESSPLTAGLYSGGSFSAAVATQTVIPPWVDPATETDLSGSTWVSTDASWPGGSGNTEGTASSSQWRLFQHSFSLPAGAVASTSTAWFSADNAASVYLNGSAVASTGGTGDVYGTSTSGTSHYATVSNASLTPVAGANTLSFVVRNWETDSDTNPTGLVYKASITYCVPAEPDNVTVTIAKYMNGEMATASSASSTSFAMNATWNADNIGAGSGSFNLSPSGFNSPDPYTAMTAEMTSGADYSVSEPMSATVGATCEAGTPYALEGYSVGNTLAEAAMATPTMTPPTLTDITENKAVIVWNRDCSIPHDVQVHILKRLNGATANASSSNGYMFPMTSTWQAANLNGGATSTGTYVLGNNHGGAADAYGAMTAEMNAGAYYTTSEVTSGDSLVLPNSATCADGKFRLLGYRHSSVSMAAAMAAPLSTSSPAFTNMLSDRYVVVENESCSDDAGTIGGDVENHGTLHVDGITVVKSTSTAAGTFADGWKYIFRVTVPDNELNVAMKFSDWMNTATSSTSTIPVANNMRISSSQASTSTPVMITAANTYSSPDLAITGDLDPSTPGKQVDILVEVSIPTTTMSGSYTTTYGIRSLP